jgi:hypothetical protein
MSTANSVRVDDVGMATLTATLTANSVRVDDVGMATFTANSVEFEVDDIGVVDVDGEHAFGQLSQIQIHRAEIHGTGSHVLIAGRDERTMLRRGVAEGPGTFVVWHRFV